MLFSTRGRVSLVFSVAFCALAGACSDDSGEGAAAVGATDGPAPDASSLEATTEVGSDSGRDAFDENPDVSVSDGADASQGDAPAEATSLEGSPADTSGDGGASGDGPGSDAVPDGGQTDGVPVLLQAGSSLVIKGVTSDDYVVYFDNVARSYYAASINGGQPRLLFALPPGGNSFVNVFGKVVTLQTWGSTASYICQLTLWSASVGQPIPLSNTTLLAFTYTSWVSEDSKSVAYVRVTNDDATLGAIYGVDPDGTHSTQLVSNVALQPSSCLPTVSFPGGGYAVASYCAAPSTGDDGDAAVDAVSPDAAADAAPPAGPTRMLTVFSLENGWAPVLTVPSPTTGFAVDPGAGRLVTASPDSNNHLRAYTLAGGVPGAILDPDTAMSFRQFVVGTSSTPWSIVYNTASGALKRTSVDAPAPETLVSGGVNYLAGKSRDAKWLVVYGTRNSVLAGDLTVVSTDAQGMSYPVATSSQFGDRPLAVSSRPGAAFTADQKYVLFFSDAVQDRRGNWVGRLRSMSLEAPHVVRALSVDNNLDSFNLPGSKVLLVDNYQEGDGGSVPTVDIHLADPASSDPAKTIVSGALGVSGVGGAVSVSSDVTKVVYSVVGGAAPGIYVAPIR